MPITIKEIQNLKRLSSSNLIKHACENCGDEYYSIRRSKFCGSACKQDSYRTRRLNEDIISQTKQEIKPTPENSKETDLGRGIALKPEALSLSQKVLHDAQKRLTEIKSKTK